MDAKINIAKILKDKPQGTKLYDLLRNIDVGLDKVYTTDVGTYIECTSTNEVGSTLLFDYSKLGTERCWLDGLQILLPSKSMRDWRKFSWKKGDVLISNDGKVKVIFEKFRSDTYQSFIGKHHLDSLDDKNLHYQDGGEYPTFNFSLESEDAALTYINTIEERLGGKLNRETLKIEKAQPEFKDGDIVFVESHMLGINTSLMITAIFRKEKEIDKYKFSPALCESNVHDTYLREYPVVLSSSDIKTFRPATDSEKQQLFDALEKEGKAWDAEKKAIVDLKKKVKLKPFDKVLVRNDKEDQWSANIFSYQVRDNMYYCLGENYWRYCIPYEGNEHLLGTTKDVEG